MQGYYKIFATILSAKLSIFILIFLAYNFLPFGVAFHNLNFLYPSHDPITLQTAYKTWDGQHYLYLSEQWYKPNHDSNAFSPLFPLTIGIARFFTGSSFFAGLLLSNIFSSLGFFLFFLLVKDLYGKDIAWKSLVFLLVFPTSFFYSLIYSESLFFCLSIAMFYFLHKKQYVIASLCSFLLPLTRGFGFVLIIPFLSYYLFEIQRLKKDVLIEDIIKKLFQKKILLVFNPLTGFLANMVLMFFATGNPFEQLFAQKYFVTQYSLLSLINPMVWLRTFFSFPLVLHGFTNSLLDRGFFLVFLLLLIPLYKRVSVSLFIFTLCMGLVPVLSGGYMSYMRHLVVIFPLFIFFARLFSEKRYTIFTFPVLYSFMSLQMLFLILQALNYWIA